MTQQSITTPTIYSAGPQKLFSSLQETSSRGTADLISRYLFFILVETLGRLLLKLKEDKDTNGLQLQFVDNKVFGMATVGEVSKNIYANQRKCFVLIAECLDRFILGEGPGWNKIRSSFYILVRSIFITPSRLSFQIRVNVLEMGT